MARHCKRHVKEYCSKSSFAGVQFIADDRKHWSERLIWVIIIILSWYGSAVLIKAAWDSFCDNPLSFGVETTYLDWETKMPAVALCGDVHDPKIYDVSDMIWTPKHPPDLEEVLKELSYFRGMLYYSLDFCHNYDIHPLCPINNITYYINLVRSTCKDMIRHCSYNGKEFDCCEYFLPVSTDIGTCFILNTIQTDTPNILPMTNNVTHRDSSLSLELTAPCKIFTIGEDEVPGLNTPLSTALWVSLGYKYRRYLSVSNIVNDPLVVQTTPEQRACKFHDENEDGLYPHYSYSTCLIKCRKKAQMDLCQCNDHFMPGTPESEQCDMSGLSCLVSYFSDLTTLRPKWAHRAGLPCDCLPSCSETVVNVIKDENTRLPKGRRKSSPTEIILAYLPTERYRRNVVRSRLDLVVSLGGTAGLFVGASLLSFVELLFYFTVRYLTDSARKQDTKLKKRTERNIFKKP